MRIDVKKVLIAGSEAQKNPFIKACQEAGIVEFTSSSKLALASDAQWSAIVQALKGLNKRREIRNLTSVNEEAFCSDEEASAFAEKSCALLEKEAQLSALFQEKNMQLRHQSVFGEFSLSRLHSIFSHSSMEVHFVFCSSRELQEIEEQLDTNQSLLPVSEVDGTLYALFFSPKDSSRDSSKLVLPSRLDHFDLTQDCGSLRKELAALSKELEELEHALDLQCEKLQPLKRFARARYNEILRKQSSQHCKDLLPGSFVVCAYLSEKELPKLAEIAREHQVFWDEISPDEKETLPTHLENEGMARVGQDLVEVYDTPSSEDKDPSLWVLCAFSLFFAMIIGDAGYGAVFLLGALLMRYKMGKTLQKGGMALRIWKLAALLSVTTLAWGTLTHSFFGITLGYDHPLRSFSFVHHLSVHKLSYHITEADATAQEIFEALPSIDRDLPPIEFAKQAMSSGRDLLSEMGDSILKELSILVGFVHLSLSMLREVRKNWANAAWIFFMLGGYFFASTMLKATVSANYLLGISPEFCSSLGSIMIFASLFSAVLLATLQHGVMGLLEIMQVIQVFSDLLSYLRLYALALAGAMLSVTFNSFALALPYGLGIFATILGHVINIGLGIMGGVIHGLRLNFLEWYHYSFEGGGRALQPLKKISSDASVHYNHS